MIGPSLGVLEIGAWSFAYFKLKSAARKQILTYGKPIPTQLPIIDNVARRYAGHPSKLQKAISNRIVAISRRVVNTKVFDYIVQGMVTGSLKSKLKKRSSINIL